jgi:hypothetical protein
MADVKDADINYPFLAWGKERASYGHGREGTYIMPREYNVQGQSGQGSKTKEEGRLLWRGHQCPTANLEKSCRKI